MQIILSYNEPKSSVSSIPFCVNFCWWPTPSVNYSSVGVLVLTSFTTPWLTDQSNSENLYFMSSIIAPLFITINKWLLNFTKRKKIECLRKSLICVSPFLSHSMEIHITDSGDITVNVRPGNLLIYGLRIKSLTGWTLALPKG